MSPDVGRCRSVLERGTKNSVDLSIVAPAYDEESALPLFIRQVAGPRLVGKGDCQP